MYDVFPNSSLDIIMKGFKPIVALLYMMKIPQVQSVIIQSMLSVDGGGLLREAALALRRKPLLWMLSS